LKTGWTVAAHASIVTTAKDKDIRVIAVVLGCQSPAGAKPEQRLRDSLAADLMTQGLAKLKKLEAEKALRLAQTPARKNPVKSKKDEGFWDWLVDLFSF
jgi:D-alanyl-D-alanine carboxypeptidase